MADAGLSPAMAMCAGIHNCAAALGISDRVGIIEAGDDAGLLLVKGDPARDLESLNRVAAVSKSGRQVDTQNPRVRENRFHASLGGGRPFTGWLARFWSS